MRLGGFLRDLLAAVGITYWTPALTPKPPVVQPPPPPIRPRPPVASDLISAHNLARTASGLKPLLPDPRLQAAAQSHADYMAAKGVMAHFGIGDGDHVARIRLAGYASETSSENVAEGQTTAAQVVKDWMNSPGHRANILGGYRDFGGAVAYGKSSGDVAGVYWCAVFANPLGVGR